MPRVELDPDYLDDSETQEAQELLGQYVAQLRGLNQMATHQNSGVLVHEEIPAFNEFSFSKQNASAARGGSLTITQIRNAQYTRLSHDE